MAAIWASWPAWPTISLPRRLCGTPWAGAEIIQKTFALDAKPRLQRALRIIDAGMDHLAVAGAGLHADMIVLFQDEGLEPAPAQAGAPPPAPPRRRRSPRHRFQSFPYPLLAAKARVAATRLPSLSAPAFMTLCAAMFFVLSKIFWMLAAPSHWLGFLVLADGDLPVAALDRRGPDFCPGGGAVAAGGWRSRPCPWCALWKTAIRARPGRRMSTAFWCWASGFDTALLRARGAPADQWRRLPAGGRLCRRAALSRSAAGVHRRLGRAGRRAFSGSGNRALCLHGAGPGSRAAGAGGALAQHL